MKNFLLLTAKVGSRGKLRTPPVVHENVNYLAITSRNTQGVEVWEQKRIHNFSNIDNHVYTTRKYDFRSRRNAKVYKVMSSLLYPQYKYTIWQDSTLYLNKDPQTIIDTYGDFDLLLFNHNKRRCIYREMETVIKDQKDTIYNILPQKHFYNAEGMPERYGVYNLSAFFKKNTPNVKLLELMWWEQICKFSSRDQCSFPYCLWKLREERGVELKIVVLEANFNSTESVFRAFDGVPHPEDSFDEA